uniref:ATP synthase complex subunit 8 n=1 Tax=Chaetoderma nitidulum TaxID=256131 RepID=D3G6C8_CHANT|nr:ATP synthase F0 subunit 8 [Chaetoderma nitidulum]ABM69276.1 ATP synthase F0 subunit 8 [Chaetoderma nitidulum]
MPQLSPMSWITLFVLLMISLLVLSILNWWNTDSKLYISPAPKKKKAKLWPWS